MINMDWTITLAICAILSVVRMICDTYKETHKKERDE